MPKALPPPVPAPRGVAFPPARFVWSVIGGASVVMRADGGALTPESRPMSQDEAFVALEGMNRADAMCRFCNGPQTDGVCEHCGMAQ